MDTFEKNNGWKILAPLFLLPVLLVAVIVLKHGKKEALNGPEVVKVAMIPAPDMQKTYHPSIEDVQKTISKGIGKEDLKENWNRMRSNLVALEIQTYSKTPYLYAVEQYRNIPDDWFESQHSKDIQLLNANKEASTAMEGLVEIIAVKEVLEDQRFKVLVGETLKLFPAEMFAKNVGSGMGMDEKIG